MTTAEYSLVGIDPPSLGTETKDQHEEHASNKTSRLPHGWRRTILAGSLAVTVVLLVNIVLLLWTVANFPYQGGAVPVFSGSCGKVKDFMTWSHLAINVLSTILLAASNSCMQVLVAPTRAEIDAAHRKHQWLDIGTQTLRNMNFIERKRIALWAILGLSSVPLHLLYNSVTVASTAMNQYNAHIVTNRFFEASPWNLSDIKRPTAWNEVNCAAWRAGNPDTYYYPIHDIQRDLESVPYVRLQPEECAVTYARSQSSYGNVVLVTNETADNSLVRWLVEDGISPTWPCEQTKNNEVKYICNINNLLADIRGNGWRLPGHQQSELREPETERQNVSNNCPSKPEHLFLIDYCLAQPTESPCSLYVAVPLLAVVVGCNLLKLIGLLITFWGLRHNPILTIGDAIDSFLRETDETTADAGIIDASNIGGWTKPHVQGARPCNSWKRTSKSGLSAVSRTRWVVINIGFASVIATACGFLSMAIDYMYNGYDTSLKGLASLGLGKIFPGGSIGPMFTKSVAENIMTCALVVNSPQLFVSILYMAYNDLFTRMAMAREWSSFYRKDGRKQPLRVSEPRGLQRSTSFLQMPFWWSVPTMVMMTCLHWMISQSIFFYMEEIFEFDKYWAQGLKLERPDTAQAVGFSPIGIIASLGVGSFMVLVLWLVAMVIRLRGEMPVVRSCSAAISAACHRPSWDDDAAIKLVSWGVWGEEGEDERVGFSSDETRPLQNGTAYSN